MDEQIVKNVYNGVPVRKSNEVLIYATEKQNELWICTTELDGSQNNYAMLKKPNKKRFN